MEYQQAVQSAGIFELANNTMLFQSLEPGGITPQVVSYTAPGAGAVEGAGGDQTYSVSLVSLANNRLIKINPYTGAVTLNVTGMTPQLLGG